MEWKQIPNPDAVAETLHLETFLGGMETGVAGAVAAGDPLLETFLGGMETRSPRTVPPIPLVP